MNIYPDSTGEKIFTCCLYLGQPRLCAVYALLITLSTVAQSTVHSTEDSERQNMHQPVRERGRKERKGMVHAKRCQ